MTHTEKLGKPFSERKACGQKWLATMSIRQTNVHYLDVLPTLEQLELR